MLPPAIADKVTVQVVVAPENAYGAPQPMPEIEPGETRDTLAVALEVFH